MKLKLNYIKTYESFLLNEEESFKNTLYGISITLLSLLNPNTMMASDVTGPTSEINIQRAERLEKIKLDLQKIRDLSSTSDEEIYIIDKVISFQENILRNNFDKNEFNKLIIILQDYLKEKELYSSFSLTIKSIQEGNIKQLRSDYITLYKTVYNDVKEGDVKSNNKGQQDGEPAWGISIFIMLFFIGFLVMAIPVNDNYSEYAEGTDGYEPLLFKLIRKTR